MNERRGGRAEGARAAEERCERGAFCVRGVAWWGLGWAARKWTVVLRRGVGTEDSCRLPAPRRDADPIRPRIGHVSVPKRQGKSPHPPGRSPWVHEPRAPSPTIPATRGGPGDGERWERPLGPRHGGRRHLGDAVTKLVFPLFFFLRERPESGQSPRRSKTGDGGRKPPRDVNKTNPFESFFPRTSPWVSGGAGGPPTKNLKFMIR